MIIFKMRIKEGNMQKKCNKETEVYSRVVGFYRPTKLWNKGKKEEFKERNEFTLSKINSALQDNFSKSKKEAQIG